MQNMKPDSSVTSKCGVNHGRIVKSDKETITFEDGVVVKKGTMEIIFEPSKDR
ncbi:MAG: hypothetical protein M1422_05665 [Candidatus Thermoplasmatota archaeon]|nr:hypothetical protein [Candidatus Thermoplasmatota archaeon]